MKKLFMKRESPLFAKSNMEPDLLVNGLKNYPFNNPSPLFFNASPNPMTDTLRKFNLSIFQSVTNPQNPENSQ